MIQNEKLTEVHVHKIEHNEFYLELVYLYEDNAGIHKVTFPHVNLANSLYHIPRYSIGKIKHNEEKDPRIHSRYHYLFGSSEEGMRILPGVVDTRLGSMDRIYYYDEIIDDHDHSIKIVDKKGVSIK